MLQIPTKNLHLITFQALMDVDIDDSYDAYIYYDSKKKYFFAYKIDENKYQDVSNQAIYQSSSIIEKDGREWKFISATPFFSSYQYVPIKILDDTLFQINQKKGENDQYIKSLQH